MNLLETKATNSVITKSHSHLAKQHICMSIEEIIYWAAVKLDFRPVGDKRATSLYNTCVS